MDSPIVSAAEMRAAEEEAFGRGIEVEALMDQAGAGVARAVEVFHRCLHIKEGDSQENSFLA